MTTIKKSWEGAADSLNSHWIINSYKENNSKLEGDGLFYSPTDDVDRPYPCFILKFTLIWSSRNKFEMKIICDKPGNISNPDGTDLFTIKKNIVYLDLSDEMKKENDVSKLLSAIYDKLFPQKDAKMIQYWIKELPHIYQDYGKT